MPATVSGFNGRRKDFHQANQKLSSEDSRTKDQIIIDEHYLH